MQRVCSSCVARDHNDTGSFCKDVDRWHIATNQGKVEQSLFAFIGKYVIMGLAALNLIREVGVGVSAAGYQ